jgi:hypothetical protein
MDFVNVMTLTTLCQMQLEQVGLLVFVTQLIIGLLQVLHVYVTQLVTLSYQEQLVYVTQQITSLPQAQLVFVMLQITGLLLELLVSVIQLLISFQMEQEDASVIQTTTG